VSCECTVFTFADNNFWSSTENSAPNAWNQNFNSGNPGNQNNNTKTNANYVRAFRRSNQVMNCDLTVSELFTAYYDCRKTKRNTWNAIQFEQRLERNLMNLFYDLVEGTYRPGGSIMFVVTKPKAREVKREQAPVLRRCERPQTVISACYAMPTPTGSGAD